MSTYLVIFKSQTVKWRERKGTRSKPFINTHNATPVRTKSSLALQITVKTFGALSMKYCMVVTLSIYKYVAAHSMYEPGDRTLLCITGQSLYE